MISCGEFPSFFWPLFFSSFVPAQNFLPWSLSSPDGSLTVSPPSMAVVTGGMQYLVMDGRMPTIAVAVRMMCYPCEYS